MGGNWGATKLDDLFQIGQISQSDEYDVGGGLHVAFSAEAVYHPTEPLSTAAPGIGANVSATNNQNPGAATVIGESYAYLKDTVLVSNSSTLDKITKSYAVTLNLDGFIHVSGDAIAQVGAAIRIAFEDGVSYTASNIWTYQEGFGGLLNTYHFGQPGQIGAPLTLTNPGPYGTELIAHDSQSLTIETLLYVRAQTGGLHRGAGTAEADFSNTLKVSNIQFFDENDQVIPGLQVVGSDGAVYPYNVPEPSTLALFGVGSFGIWFARGRARFQKTAIE